MFKYININLIKYLEWPQTPDLKKINVFNIKHHYIYKFYDENKSILNNFSVDKKKLKLIHRCGENNSKIGVITDDCYHRLCFLYKSIKKNGFIFDKKSPIMVVLQNGKFIVESGKHRFFTCLFLNIKDIPVHLRF
jgi:hypothetical protein